MAALRRERVDGAFPGATGLSGRWIPAVSSRPVAAACCLAPRLPRRPPLLRFLQRDVDTARTRFPAGADTGPPDDAPSLLWPSTISAVSCTIWPPAANCVK